MYLTLTSEILLVLNTSDWGAVWGKAWWTLAWTSTVSAVAAAVEANCIIVVDRQRGVARRRRYCSRQREKLHSGTVHVVAILALQQQLRLYCHHFHEHTIRRRVTLDSPLLHTQCQIARGVIRRAEWNL